MTTTVNTSNSASAPTTSNRLGDQKTSPILEEATAEKTSDVALGTLQQSLPELSLVLQKQDQLSAELKQLSLKLSVIFQNQDHLFSKLIQHSLKPSLVLQVDTLENKESIKSRPPTPPPPPPSKTSLKDQENKASVEEQKQKDSIPSNSTNKTPNNLGTVINGQMKDHIEKMRLKWAENNTTANSTLQNSITPTVETKSTIQNGTNLHQSKSLYVKRNNNKKENETSEVKESTTFAERLAQFKTLSQKPN